MSWPTRPDWTKPCSPPQLSREHPRGFRRERPADACVVSPPDWAAVTSGLLASFAIVPAAFARMEPDPGAGYVSTRVAQIPATTVRVVTTGGMPGWQITLIALGAALLAATAAVLVSRALAARTPPALAA